MSNDIWRASSINADVHNGIPSTYSLLDQHLYGGGWPQDGLTELLLNKLGIGELRLLTPALAKLSQEQNRWLLWVSPPHIPYAPALAKAGIDLSKILIVNTTSHVDMLWVLEKALSSKSCSAVLAWPDFLSAEKASTEKKSTEKARTKQIPQLEKHLRRLQIASKEGQCLGILFRNNSAAKNASPAELRIQLQAQVAVSEHSRLKVKVLKRKGGWPSDFLDIEFNDHLNLMTPDFSELQINNHSDSLPDCLSPKDAQKNAPIDTYSSHHLNPHL
ncbi:MAG: hypothetical protein JKY88_14620 [Pseudomonadales bacterium]|nr:hypothetical protein [Pseudomonadales bacterium]